MDPIRFLQHALFYLCAVQYIAHKEAHTPTSGAILLYEAGDYEAVKFLAEHIGKLRTASRSVHALKRDI